MIESIVIEFEKVTKYPLLDFMREYRDFMKYSYGAVERYFSGVVESIDNEHINALKKVTNDTQDVLQQFKNFANKFEKCGYWELMDFIDDLNTTMAKINKLPKFKRTVLSKRGYTNTVETKTTVGGFRTMDDVANEVNSRTSDNYGWVDFMLNNDMDEVDWEIDKLSGVNVYYSKRKINVTTIVDMPFDKRIYGKDFCRKIAFTDNDFELVSEENNIEQKCDILLSVKQGDVPENMLFGVNPFFLGGNVASNNILEIVRQIQSVFQQNDLFESAYVTNIKYDNNGSLNIAVNIKTRYEYCIEKQITL